MMKRSFQVLSAAVMIVSAFALGGCAEESKKDEKKLTSSDAICSAEDGCTRTSSGGTTKTISCGAGYVQLDDGTCAPQVACPAGYTLVITNGVGKCEQCL